MAADRRRRLLAAAGSLALTLVIGAAACAPGGAEPRGDVILVILDTTRADHFSSYGYPRLTTPNFDRLAADGERYTRAWSQAPWTLPSIATILTGQPPHVHGAMRGESGFFGVRPDVRTLAERLSSAGYRSAAFINVVWCNPELSQLDRGFEHYDFRSSDASNPVRAT